jgi:hypothetical protein
MMNKMSIKSMKVSFVQIRSREKSETSGMISGK